MAENKTSDLTGPTTGQKTGPATGRKAAYFARNRTALLKSTQALLGTRGWNATIQEVAENADVAVSTIYMHFETKEALFETAVIDAMHSWESWALAQVTKVEDPLEQLVTPMRLMVRCGATHPSFAAMIAKNLSEVNALIPLFTQNLGVHLRQLVKAGVLSIDNQDVRISNVKAILIKALEEQLLNPNVNPKDADLALEIALPMIGIDAEKAKQLVSLPLPIDATKDQTLQL